MAGYFGGYGTVGVLLLVGVALLVGVFGLNALIGPRRATGDALTTYECGVDAVDTVDMAWAQTHIRYYVYAYAYVIFAVEAVFLFPWATVFAAPGFGAATFAEMGVFAGLVALGLLYAWRKRVLTWD